MINFLLYFSRALYLLGYVACIQNINGRFTRHCQSIESKQQDIVCTQRSHIQVMFSQSVVVDQKMGCRLGDLSSNPVSITDSVDRDRLVISLCSPVESQGSYMTELILCSELKKNRYESENEKGGIAAA